MNLLLGKKGQLAWAFQRQFKSPLKVLGSEEINFLEPDKVLQKLDELKPSLVINTCAYTKVDQAEKERDICETINSKTPLS